MTTRPRAALRRVIAWGGHAPGLWVFYRERLPPRLWKANLIAVLLALVAMGCVGAITADGVCVVLVWLLGHIAWGTYLACRLPAAAETRSADNAAPAGEAKL